MPPDSAACVNTLLHHRRRAPPTFLPTSRPPQSCQLNPVRSGCGGTRADCLTSVSRRRSFATGALTWMLGSHVISSRLPANRETNSASRRQACSPKRTFVQPNSLTSLPKSTRNPPVNFHQPRLSLVRAFARCSSKTWHPRHRAFLIWMLLAASRTEARDG